MKDLDAKILIKQNKQMFVQLQTYRHANLQLTAQNKKLNVWVLSLSQVFAAIAGAWKTITDGEEAFYALLRRRGDTSKLTKYIHHFRAFEQIITHLGEKLTNEGHSQAATMEACTRISAFVANYKLFFNEFVELYFRLNEEYAAWSQEMARQTDVPQVARTAMSKNIQLTARLADMKPYFSMLEKMGANYAVSGQQQLLSELLGARNGEIEALRAKVEKQRRSIALMTDYNSNAGEVVIGDHSVFECECGAAPLQYYSARYEEGFKKEAVVEEGRVKKEDVQLMEEQKGRLIERNTSLQLKLERLKQQYKFNEDTVMGSHAYYLLRTQCREMMVYASDVMGRLNRHYDHLAEIERARLDEIDEIKRRGGSTNGCSLPHVQTLSHTTIKEYESSIKQEITGAVKALLESNKALRQLFNDRDDNLTKCKAFIEELQREKTNLEAALQASQAQRAVPLVLQFRHEKFAEIEAAVNELLSKEEQSNRIKRGWEQFVEYVKSRDKKIRDLENQIKKKEKEVGDKSRTEQALKETVIETENIYMGYKERLDKFQEFVKRVEGELAGLGEENFRIKVEHEREKGVLQSKLRVESEARCRLEEKSRQIDKIEEQVQLMRRAEEALRGKFNDFLLKERDRYEQLALDCKEKERVSDQLKLLVDEKEKLVERAVEEKEKAKAELSKYFVRIRALENKSKSEVMEIELENYRRKVMCNCGGEREREVVLKTCPHMFCKKCIDQSTAHRNRKCPSCGVRFTKSDIHDICWN